MSIRLQIANAPTASCESAGLAVIPGSAPSDRRTERRSRSLLPLRFPSCFVRTLWTAAATSPR